MKHARKIFNTDPQTLEQAIILMEKYGGKITGKQNGYDLITFPDNSTLLIHPVTGNAREPTKIKRQGGKRKGAGRKPSEYQTIKIKRPRSQIAQMGGEKEAAQILTEVLDSL